MIARDISGFIGEVRTQFCVLSILGPRQSGKTTLAKSLFPNYGYVNFEDPITLDQARSDLKAFMRLHPAPLIIDEVQRFPAILDAVQVWVDEHRDQKASFVLTGSDQPHLRGALSESLAGRVALTYLLPLSFAELRGKTAFDRAGSVYAGFMPDVHAKSARPSILYENYVATYVMRDVNRLVNLKDVARFTAFLRLLAARVGQIVNYESLACEIGVSANTVKDWIGVLEASFIVFRLQPYYRNFGKRFVKSPKIYFTEVGLAAFLLDLHSAAEVERDPLFGQLFENMVVANFRKNRFNAGQTHLGTGGMYFLRDSAGNEVDLVLETGGRKLDLIEIKSAMSFNPDHARTIEKYAKIMGDDFNRGMVVYAGDRAECRGVEFVNFAET